MKPIPRCIAIDQTRCPRPEWTTRGEGQALIDCMMHARRAA